MSDSSREACSSQQGATAMSQSGSRVTSLERQLVEIKKVQELTELQLKQEVAKTEKLNEAKLEQKKVIVDLSDELSQAKLEIKKSLSEHNRLVSEKVQIAKSFDAERKSVQRKQQEIEDGKNALRLSSDEVQLLLKELDVLRKRESQFNRDISVLKRENAIQLTSIQAAHDKVKKGSATVHQNEIAHSLLLSDASFAHYYNKFNPRYLPHTAAFIFCYAYHILRATINSTHANH